MKTHWKSQRDKLLGTKISRLGLNLGAPPLSRCVAALYRELVEAGIRFRPPCYLSDAWGCPDLIPLIGIPFYLARPDLSRLHREMGYDVEDASTIMRLLRHEAGHALCYAYLLHMRRDWQKLFGHFHKAYSDQYVPNPFSTQHVIYGKHYYAQKHPDEDFAEAFAVWLDPRSGWKKIYGGTPAIHKLLFFREIVREIGEKPPVVRSRKKDSPVGEMHFTLLEYYGLTPEAHRRETAAYRDAIVRKVFSAGAAPRSMSAREFMRLHGPLLVERISFWSGLDRSNVKRLLHGFMRRAARLTLRVPEGRSHSALIDLASLLTFFVHTYIHTKKFSVR
jgi:hypothetical protein